ncbi:MAG: ATP-binding cassette domain-containing protein [Blautia sp.]|uniref:ABC transporter ATP-binding protein n=1 Tax=Blautia sp. TaxID=1955243 RepID=UPI002A7504C7|nr:ATP-binding cassette domain-containing protein [Blautia sp.]MDY3017295.1 ATP-binding cassette domain-containing protein [Blautia sp.]
MAIIEIDNISKEFSGDIVLHPVSISFEKGKIYGIIGRNGSGKTVLLKIISGFLRPTTGTVTINGISLGKKNEFPKNTGILIEKPGFLPYKSGFQNLKYLSQIQKLINDQEIYKVLEQTGLTSAAKKLVGKYSMGMKQRLGIAQAIMENPEILILDEPMNGLDDQGASQMRKLFLQLRNEGKTILLASHMQEDIHELCDKVYRIDAGIIEEIKI